MNTPSSFKNITEDLTDKSGNSKITDRLLKKAINDTDTLRKELL